MSSDNSLPPVQLPEALAEIVGTLPDPDFAGRLRRVWEAAVRALSGMGEVELGRYVELAETGLPDLSVWEQVAPVIRDMVLDVNRLLTTVRELFPTEPRGGIADLIGEVLEEAAGEAGQGVLVQREEEARQQIQTCAAVLAAEVSNLGERVRSPQVVSDRWNLLTDVQESRGKFRAAVSDLVFLSASALAPVSRGEVIPGWADEVQESVAARRAVTDLARVLAAHHARLVAAAPEERGPRIEALVRDLDAFGRSRAYVLLRVPDKRRLVEFRALLRRLVTSPAVALDAVRELADFAQGLSHINRRQILVEHDREVFAACAVQLERADALRPRRPREAALGLAEAARLAEALYGRNPSLDTWLRKARRRDLAATPAAALEAEIELLRGLLATAMAG
jgi:hypothetical protein